MDNRLKTPLTAVVAIFICSIFGAVIAFKFLDSSATFEDKNGLKLGGAIVGFLVTFAALWKAFYSFSSDLGRTDRKLLEEQIKNLQNQLVRQNPPPAGYRRLLSEDFKLVAHVPLDWPITDNTMIIFAPQSTGNFMDNIVIWRTLARRQYRQLQLQIAKNELGAAHPEAINNPTQYPEIQKRMIDLDRDFQLHRDDPLHAEEKIDDVLKLEIEFYGSKLLGLAEHLEIAKYPAIRYQFRNPASDVIGHTIVSLVTEIFVNEGDGYIYQVVLTSPAETLSTRTQVYNKIIGSLTFFT
jgi:hypothetical protein